MASPLEEVFLIHQQDIKIAEAFGIADQNLDGPEQFAKKCICSTFNLQQEQCREVLNKHWDSLDRIRDTLATSMPLGEEPIEVSIVRLVWESVIPGLKIHFSKAVALENFKKQLEGDDPIQVIRDELNKRFDRGTKSVQNDLKPVIGLINNYSGHILNGMIHLAKILQCNEVEYAQNVATACVSGSIPQKGLHLTVCLIALIGGASPEIASKQIRVVKLLLEAPPENIRTAAVSRLSETKTVLRELGLATIPRHRHHAVPVFKPGVTELLWSVMQKIR